tara:strand:- start:974 stop:1504 length:531 start_codon:yes stop_codon:yes gene_type:complete
MSWWSIIKNQIASTKGKTFQLDFNRPMVEEEDEDCFKYFYDLVKLMHPDFELKRQNYPDDIQSEDYWCRVKDTGWKQVSEGEFNESWAIGEDVIEPDYAELMIYYHKVGYEGDNYTAITIQIPESYDPALTEQRFVVSYADNGRLEKPDSKTKRKSVSQSDIKEIWKKMQQHMRSL